MPTHVALLRGINLAGRNRVAMAALRDVVEGLGHTDVATWIQSGNVVFTSTGTDPSVLAAALEQAIGDQLAVRPRVVVLSCQELAQVVADNPFAGEDNPKLVHAVFWNGPLGREELAAVAAAQRQSRELGDRAQAADHVRRRREPPVSIGSVVVDCDNFGGMVTSWQEAPHYVPRDPDPDPDPDPECNLFCVVDTSGPTNG